MEAKRKQMIRSANVYGFTSKQTVQYSQELDHLMNIYRRLTVGTPNNKTERTEVFQ
ncbi:stage 0 sporulation regulatory protein [Evansella vedderi]|uniref:Stage 0 sporulation regulatory protein n=1 Tax=Evansella vedderi TaxID=38282 RepID=A0ABU0A2N2_9BACI|nr:aspartyl-phosphate phosphatase Spo0E family protein [Evansella vedderi]MDQ0257262.1 stage 0 sporulation regulatory protein [Evansella vedderi]